MKTLSDALQINKNTCWKFRLKVEERKEEVKKNKKFIKDWKDLILE